MALITCPECGNEVSEKAASCPKCGYILKQSEISKVKEILSRKKLPIFICCLVLIGVATTVFIDSNHLNEYEKLALENCRDLISTLKAPDSFALHGDIMLEVYPQFENSVYDDPEVYTDTGTITFMYIPYGAENGYGGMSVGTALYRNNEQRFSDIEDLGGGLQGAINEYQYALFESFKAEAEIEEANGNISITRVIVNADKILKHLKD